MASPIRFSLHYCPVARSGCLVTIRNQFPCRGLTDWTTWRICGLSLWAAIGVESKNRTGEKLQILEMVPVYFDCRQLPVALCENHKNSSSIVKIFMKSVSRAALRALGSVAL